MENRLITVAFIAFVLGSANHVVSSMSFDAPVPCASLKDCQNDSRFPPDAFCNELHYCVSSQNAPESATILPKISSTLQQSNPTYSSPKPADLTSRSSASDARFCAIPCNRPFEQCNITRKQCECQEGYVLASKRRQCLLVATTLGSNCTEDQQCQKKMGNTTCSDEQCICSDGFHTVGNNECWKSLMVGDHCTNHKECSHVDGAECDQKTSRCTCQMGTTVNSMGDKCLALADMMFESCIEKAQCSEKFHNSDCIDKQCQCQENYHFNKTLLHCASNPSLGGSCSENYECDQGESPGMPRSQLCVDNLCTCNTSFVQNGDFCIAGAASLVPGLLSILSAILLFSRW